MNENEIKYFSKEELKFYDATSLPILYLLKSLFIKIRRKTWGRYYDRKSRMIWTVNTISDASGLESNIRNYYERQTIRSILSFIHNKYTISTACEVGCGFGRLIMVLQEFSTKVVGFEREHHLVGIARTLLPKIEFCQVESLDKLNILGKGPFDFVLTSTVLQHLTDNFCQKVLEEIKHLSPKGHVLLIEKTEAIMTTSNIQDGNSFISRARPIDTYAQWMKPYRLISTSERIIEPTYPYPKPGTCMLFRSSLLDNK